MGARGPKPVSRQELHVLASEFYWDFRHLAEGYSHPWLDRQRYGQLKTALEDSRLLSDEDEAAFAQRSEQIRNARLKESEKEERLRRLEEDTMWNAFNRGMEGVYEASMTQVKVPGKPEIVDALLRAAKPEDVREICRDAFVTTFVEVEDPVERKVVGHHRQRVLTWSVSNEKFPRRLAAFANEFVAAKNDLRFPRSNRPSNQLKQLWFLARALAGAVFGVSTRTAINLVGSMRPEQLFDKSRAGKSVRTRKDKRSTRVRGQLRY